MSNSLAKYSPETSIFEHFEVDVDLPKKDRAFATWRALLSAKRGSDGLFLVIGKLLKDVRDEKLYLSLDYDNFGQFLNSEELGFSREKAYMCIKTYEYYVEYLELDPERVGSMNISRLSLMVPALRQIEDKTEVVKQIEEMNNLRHNDFIKEIKKRYNRDGKPSVFFNTEMNMWYVGYHPDRTHLHDLGNFKKED